MDFIKKYWVWITVGLIVLVAYVPILNTPSIVSSGKVSLLTYLSLKLQMQTNPLAA